MLSRDEQVGLAEIAQHLERDDPRLATALRRGGRPASAAVPAAAAMIVVGTACFVLALSVPSGSLFVLGLATLIAGWTGLIVRCAR